MLRIVLIGVGLMATTLTSYYARKKLTKRIRDQFNVGLDAQEGQKPSGRTKKSRSPSLHRVLKNGELTLDP